MKNDEKNVLMKSRILRIFITLIIVLSFNILFFNQVQAVTVTTSLPEYSKAYKDWLQIPDDEKKNYIEPNPYTVSYDTSTQVFQKSRLGMFANLKTSLASQYQIQDLTVKNQQNTGFCWAFSSTTMLESNFEKLNNNAKSPLYSPRHIEYSTAKEFLDGTNPKAFNRTVGSGGNSVLAMAYCTSGQGPILETDMPFKNTSEKINLSEIEGKTVVRQVNEFREFPAIYKTYDGGTITYSNGNVANKIIYDDDQVNQMRDNIKQHIIQYGAVTAYNHSGGVNVMDKYYNESKVQLNSQIPYAYYCNEPDEKPDHQITIVGWDDNFSKDNFNDDRKPIHNGAWIVQNSWGTEKLNDGYMYVSYDDALIEQGIVGIVNSSDVTYDNIYQYDPLGCSTQIGLSEEGVTSTFIYGANVFKRNTSTGKKEMLTDIGFSILTPTNISVYANAESNDKTKLKLIKNMGVLEAGYYTCHLDTPLELKGSEFVVAIKYSADVSGLPVELNFTSNGLGSNQWDTATSEPGQSYYSFDGAQSWEDITEVLVGEGGIKKLKDTNVCIKAFTTYEEPDKTVNVTDVILNKTSYTIQQGGTYMLQALVQPEDATNKKVTWTSDNQTVATVNGSGFITALSEGTANITVTTEDQHKTAVCKVTVQEKGLEIVEVSGVRLNKTSYNMSIGQIVILEEIVEPENAVNKNVIWSSDKPEVARVENGIVTALSEGVANIEVTTEQGGKTASCQITVNKDNYVPVEGINLSANTAVVQVGRQTALLAGVVPSNASNKTVNWYSDDEDIAVVDDEGTITGVSVGTAEITAQTEDGNKTATCQITVIDSSESGNPDHPDDPNYVEIQRISLNINGITMHIGDSYRLIATITPDNATNKDLIWETADSSIATVDQNGVIRAVDKGITTITVKSEADDVSESCVVSVLDAEEDANRKDEIITITPEGSQQNGSNSGGSAGTVSPDPIPQAGSRYIIIALLILGSIVAVIGFIKIHQSKDVK